MVSVLFLSYIPSPLPEMAKSIAESIAPKDVRILSASSADLESDIMDKSKKAMKEVGLEISGQSLSIEDVDFHSFDLIVCFTEDTCSLLPSIPGNPLIIRWLVPGFPQGMDKKMNIEDIKKIREKVLQLVTDLFQQGYLMALVQARKNSELIMDNLKEGILVHDLSRRIYYFNRAAEEITGYKRENIVGKDCHDAFPGRFCDVKCTFCNGKTHGIDIPYQYPLTINTRSGALKKIEMTVVPLKDAFGKPLGVVGSFKDVTREFELSKRLGEVEQFSGIIGKSEKMQLIYQTIRDVAESKIPVLIQGESGTGKELVAAAIHNKSSRAKKLFVPVNCGALPDTLLESELFGHLKGAFTGAIRDKKGRFELADGGTLFLDEIGDISPAMQVKLLRVLQDGMVEKLGSEQGIKVDVRIISATNKDLKIEVDEGRFREDLYYRLCVVPINLPSLRERKEDIPLLVNHFLKELTDMAGRPEMVVSSQAMELIQAYHWQGNVRELMNCLQYAIVRCKGIVIEPSNLPSYILDKKKRQERVTIPSWRKRKGKLDLAMVNKALEKAQNNKTEAARLLGVGRATLYRFIANNNLL